jgi:hypothetical protein
MNATTPRHTVRTLRGVGRGADTRHFPQSFSQRYAEDCHPLTVPTIQWYAAQHRPFKRGRQQEIAI